MVLRANRALDIQAEADRRARVKAEVKEEPKNGGIW